MLLISLEGITSVLINHHLEPLPEKKSMSGRNMHFVVQQEKGYSQRYTVLLSIAISHGK
jgi:hypothetical protein